MYIFLMVLKLNAVYLNPHTVAVLIWPAATVQGAGVAMAASGEHVLVWHELIPRSLCGPHSMHHYNSVVVSVVCVVQIQLGEGCEYD